MELFLQFSRELGMSALPLVFFALFMTRFTQNLKKNLLKQN